MKRTGAILLLAALWLAAGCEEPTPPPPPTHPTQTSPPAQAKPDQPDVPHGAKLDELVSQPMIKDTTLADARRTASYRRAPKVPAGGLIGLCFIPFDKPVTVPYRFDLAVEGPNAVRAPVKGEAAYYKTHLPQRRVLLGAYNPARKRYGVERAAIIIRGVKAGARLPLQRPGLVVDYRTAQLRVPKPGYNYGSGNVIFMPPSERIAFRNTEFYPFDLTVTRVGAGGTVFQGRLAGYTDPKFPGQRFGSQFNMTPPDLLQTSAITTPGLYRVTCRRHPWILAHVLAVDSPYVALSDEAGVFRIGDLPQGKYALEVWHPLYRAVQPRQEIEVVAHRTPELLIPFKPPPLLTDPPPLPQTLVPRWAAVGPFEIGRKTYPPETRLNFKGAWPTAYKYHAVKQPLRWQVSDGRLGHYYATAFFYTALQSPKAQKVRLGFGARSHTRGWQGVYTVRAWVNGAAIYQYHGDWHGTNAAVVSHKLNAGHNDLLIRLDTSRYNHWASIEVRFEAEGVTARLPETLRPKPKK